MSDYPDESLFEGLIQSLLQTGYGVADHFLPLNDLEGLRNNLLTYFDTGMMGEAGIGRHFDYQKNTNIRGDVIRWIEDDSADSFERKYLDRIGYFIRYLNKTCYTNINAFELHYAYYEPGSFYKKHLDQFKKDRGRKFSVVLYLNEKWDTEDQGELKLFPENLPEVKILPVEGRLVFFKSDELAHEVCSSFTRPRLSIAGWLKSI